MSDISLKVSDRLPLLQATLGTGSAPIDLTSATGYFVYKPLYSGAATIRDATIAVPLSGIVQYQWTTGDSASIGVYRYEWRVNLPNGKQVTFPNDTYDTFTIISGLI